MNLCQFIASVAAQYPVALSCRLLGLPRTSFYAWRARQAGRRTPSARARADGALTTRIRAIYAASHQTDGSPRVQAELRDARIRCGGKRVARLMRQAHLVACQRRRWSPRTTTADPQASPAPDRLERNFTATAPNQVWVSDITYVATGEGWLYLAVVLDLFSRKVVGWAMANHLRTELALDALEFALHRQQSRHADGPAGKRLIFHSDHGCQYTATAFRQRLQQAGIMSSMGSVGDCYDNAVAESCFATLKTELLYRHDWPTHADVRAAIFRYIEGWYNPRRRHSTLGYRSPDQFEQLYFHRQSIAA